MAAKKYLSLEEAAQVLGLRSDEVIRMRERGDLRGFADRGTWKFKSDDVEEAKRRRQPDSNPDVPLIDDESSILDDDVDLGSQATMVRGSTSDSDVRLILDDNLQSKPLAGSSAELPILTGPGSDSDVRLVGSPSAVPLMGSDSDVKLLKPKTSDSGIRLSDSDSDVRLASPGKGSDSDVKLVPSAGGLRPGRAGSGDYDDLDAGESVLLEHDSGIHLPEGSSVKLTGGSSLRLTSDSGIRLKSPADSGILLEGPADSGIKLQSTGASGLGLGSGLALGPSSSVRSGKGNRPADDLDMTSPMLFEPRDDMSGTDPEVPMLSSGDDDDLMPKSKGMGDTHAETSVIMFDDDDEDLDQVAATQIKKKKSPGLSGVNFEDSSSDVETVEEYADDDELEVSDDILGEDDELEEMEVFDTEDSDFSDSFSEGASSTDFSPRGLGKIAVTEREWSGVDMSLVLASTVALTVGVMVGVDLLRTVWGAGSPMDNGPFMALFGGLFQ